MDVEKYSDNQHLLDEKGEPCREKIAEEMSLVLKNKLADLSFINEFEQSNASIPKNTPEFWELLLQAGRSQYLELPYYKMRYSQGKSESESEVATVLLSTMAFFVNGDPKNPQFHQAQFCDEMMNFMLSS